MKLTIKKTTLVNALQVITPITDKSSSKPILSNFLLRAEGEGDEGRVQLSATDYELSITGEFPATVSEPGSVCISAKKVLDVCREFPAEEIEIAADEQLWVMLQGGPARLRLPSVEIGLYPQMEVMDLPYAFTIKAGDLKQCIDLTLFATLANETRKNLMGVCLGLKEDRHANWVATDGHRLAQVRRAVETDASDETPEIIVPRKALAEMQRVLEGVEETVRVAFDERNLVLTTENTVLMTRLIEGKFPNVDPVIPKDNDKSVVVDRERMINALRIISYMSNEKIKPVKLSLEPAQLRLESERAEYGDVADELPVEYDGEAFKIGFNAGYLLDVLTKVTFAKQVEMKMKGALNPCLIKVPDDPSFLSVVMPLRIEW